jgi:hypothetical protein
VVLQADVLSQIRLPVQPSLPPFLVQPALEAVTPSQYTRVKVGSVYCPALAATFSGPFVHVVAPQTVVLGAGWQAPAPLLAQVLLSAAEAAHAVSRAPAGM